MKKIVTITQFAFTSITLASSHGLAAGEKEDFRKATYDGFDDLSTTGRNGFGLALSSAMSAKFGVERDLFSVASLGSVADGGSGAFLFCFCASSLSLLA